MDGRVCDTSNTYMDYIAAIYVSENIKESVLLFYIAPTKYV